MVGLSKGEGVDDDIDVGVDAEDEVRGETTVGEEEGVDEDVEEGVVVGSTEGEEVISIT